MINSEVGRTERVRSYKLTDTEIRDFARRGLVLPGLVLTQEQVADIRERIDAIVEQEARDGVDRYEVAPSAIFLTGLWKRDDAIRSVAFDERILRWAGQLLNTQTLAFMLDNVIVKPPKVGGEIHWHQDWHAWPVDPSEVVTIWIALEHVTSANGAMQMVVGSHALGRFLPLDSATGEVHANCEDLVERGLKAMPHPSELGTGLEITTIELLPGEASLHHGLMWHCSGPNTGESTRHSLILRYADGSAKYSGTDYVRTSFGVHPQYVGQRLDEIDLFEVCEVPEELAQEW